MKDSRGEELAYACCCGSRGTRLRGIREEKVTRGTRTRTAFALLRRHSHVLVDPCHSVHAHSGDVFGLEKGLSRGVTEGNTR